MTLAELREKREDILRIAAKHGACNVRVFGSVARGEADETSDVDVLVDMEGGRSLLDLIGFEQDMTDMVGRPVDVLTADGISAWLRDTILTEATAL